MNILITGEKGYIAKFLYNSLTRMNEHFNVEKKSVKSGTSKESLTNIEVVIHLAALVHKKEMPEFSHEYDRVNFYLTKELATLAKEQGVKHFIFVSTMAVYGNSNSEIKEQTPTIPTTFYGKSKLAAEEALIQLQDEQFQVSIIRPPMVYGPNCPGNYTTLKKLSMLTPLFPQVNNKRSMIYIENLIEFILQVIQYRDAGIFHPQDPQFINTTNMVCSISKVHGKKIITTTVGATLLKLTIGKLEIYKKVFGDLYYCQSLSDYRDNSYQKYSVEDAIKISEKEKINETYF